MENLKLFVWENVLCDAGCGMMFALAKDVEMAQEAIVREMATMVDKAGENYMKFVPVDIEEYRAYRRGEEPVVSRYTLENFKELDQPPMIFEEEKGFLVYGGS